jgi:hypothetical protein
VGHSSTTVTELIYRQQIRPVLQAGALVIDQIVNERYTRRDGRIRTGGLLLPKQAR